MSLGKLWSNSTVDALAEIGREIGDVQTFLGAPIARIEPIILRLALRTDRAEWLRGAHHVGLLPRFQWSTGCGFEKFPIPEQIEPRCDIIEWVVEQLRDTWFFDSRYVYLDSEYDRVMFRLRWS